MAPLFLQIGLIIAALLPGGLAVADNERVPGSASAQADESTKTAPKISSGKRGEVETLEEFIPSEEISADKPISFPVDI